MTKFIKKTNQKKLVNKKNFFFFTYASDYDGALPFGYIREFWEKYILKFHPRCYCVIVSEGPDGEIKRNHFHGLIYDPFKQFNINTNSLDIELKYPVIAFYLGESGDGNVLGYEPWETRTDINQLLENYGAADWAVHKKAHPNIKKTEGYGSYESIFDYITKKIYEGTAWSTHPIEQIKEVLKKLDKTSPFNKLGRKKDIEPDFKEMYEKGWSVTEVLDYLRKNYTNLFVKKYYQWSAGIHAVFFQEEDEYTFKPGLEFYIPIKIIDWLESIRPFLENYNNKQWIKKHRHERPRSLIWFGASKRGKTTFIRQFFFMICNYYQFLFDGLENFNEYFPIVVLDDFGINLNQYLPGWKCWLGAQTSFSVNPK